MKLLEKIRKAKWLKIIAVIVFVLTLYIMRVYEKDFNVYSNGADALDMRFGYGVTECYQLLTGLGEAGRAIYIKILLDDFVFITSFLFLQDFIMKRVVGESGRKSRLRYLLSLSYLRAIFDYLENIITIALIIYLPNELDIPVRLLSFITQLKFVALGLWLAALLVVPVIRLVKRRRTV